MFTTPPSTENPEISHHNLVAVIWLTERAAADSVRAFGDRISKLRAHGFYPLGCVVFDDVFGAAAVVACYDPRNDPTSAAVLFASDLAVEIFPGSQFHTVCSHFAARLQAGETLQSPSGCCGAGAVGRGSSRTCRCILADVLEMTTIPGSDDLLVTCV